MLEDSLQVTLFVWLGNRVALTEEGHALKPRIGEAVAIMAECCALASRISDNQSINVSAEPAFATRWLRPRLVLRRNAHRTRS